MFFGWLLWSGQVRSKLNRALLVGTLLAVAVVAVKPNLFQSQTIGRLLSARDGTNDTTLSWRMNERWPHFLAIVERHPWLGTGTAVDPSLGGVDGNTPHNGYLALALISGVPFAIGFCLMTLLGLRNALRLARRAKTVQQMVLGATLAAGVTGILIHNLVEVTFEHDFVGKLLWVLVATATVAARQTAARQTAARRPPLAVPAAPVAHRRDRHATLAPIGAHS
jgi:O-antigen ligase